VSFEALIDMDVGLVRSVLPAVAIALVFVAAHAEEARHAAAHQHFDGSLHHCDKPMLPRTFEINEIPLPTGWRFEVRSSDRGDDDDGQGGQHFGEVVMDMSKLREGLMWTSPEHHMQSFGMQASLAWGDQVTIEDCDQQPLAILEEELQQSWFSSNMGWTNYKIRDPSGRLAGYSRKVQWAGTPQFKIHSPDGSHVLAELSYPMLPWGRQWQITRMNFVDIKPTALSQDPRVLVMLAAYHRNMRPSLAKSVIIWVLSLGFTAAGFCYVLLFVCRGNTNPPVTNHEVAPLLLSPMISNDKYIVNANKAEYGSVDYYDRRRNSFDCVGVGIYQQEKKDKRGHGRQTDGRRGVWMDVGEEHQDGYQSV